MICLLILVFTIVAHFDELRIEAGDWPDTAAQSAEWDLELTYATGTVRTILAGPVRILDDVTVLVG